MAKPPNYTVWDRRSSRMSYVLQKNLCFFYDPLKQNGPLQDVYIKLLATKGT